MSIQERDETREEKITRELPALHTPDEVGYDAFLETKRIEASDTGVTLDASDIHPALFPFQRDIVLWALSKGRAAIFADTGLGKTLMQLEWARHIVDVTDLPVLIFAPLAVAQQTAREAQKLSIPATICRSQDDVRQGVNIANYEMLRHFTAKYFSGIVIDESSILKSYDGVTRKALTDFAQEIPFRLACTATPAPNDITEIINHAEFLSVMRGKEILALFFTQDGNSAHDWRIKGHAKRDFWRWLSSWAMALRNPADLGYDGSRFRLPPLRSHQHTVAASALPGQLFMVEAKTLAERRGARRASLDERVALTADMVNTTDGPWLIWCDLNDESKALTNSIPDAVEVTGSDTLDHKSQAMLDFAAGKIRVLVSKPSICGFGMNWQHCHQVAFVGLSDSWEQYYQAVRRCWRFGQTSPVDVHIIASEAEGAVIANIERKEREASALMDGLVAEVAARSSVHAGTISSRRDEMVYEEAGTSGKGWNLYLGDSVIRMDDIETESVGLSIFSPPFPGMYAYTNSVHDMGNTRNIEEMMRQFSYLVGPEKLLRILMPGRMACIHLTQVPAFKGADGYIGLKDFRGDTISMMQRAGWIYYGEVTIDKDPQVKAQRTKERGLMFKTLATDSSLMRMAMADYLLYFMKPGQNPRPIRAGKSERYGNDHGWITNDEWIEWAHPVWYNIRETNVLNVRVARESDDERHLAPLQLDVIERAVKLWSAPDDLVFSPFAGIGSEGYMALKLGRRFAGIELKRSYFETAARNLREAERVAQSSTLWGGDGEEAAE